MSAAAPFLLAATLAAVPPTPTLFTDVTLPAGIPSLKYGEGVNFRDLDDDGLPELFLPVVKGRNLLLRNLGHGRFREETSERGLTGDNGIALTDIDIRTNR